MYTIPPCQQIGLTIVAQLGGRKFTVMTGARNIMTFSNGLQFKLPSRFAKDGINFVKITLETDDTYTVEFGKIWGTKYKVLQIRENVYADNLQTVFTSVTGLDTHL